MMSEYHDVNRYMYMYMYIHVHVSHMLNVTACVLEGSWWDMESTGGGV